MSTMTKVKVYNGHIAHKVRCFDCTGCIRLLSYMCCAHSRLPCLSRAISTVTNLLECHFEPYWTRSRAARTTAIDTSSARLTWIKELTTGFWFFFPPLLVPPIQKTPISRWDPLSAFGKCHNGWIDLSDNITSQQTRCQPNSWSNAASWWSLILHMYQGYSKQCHHDLHYHDRSHLGTLQGILSGHVL